jgi:hypothetical protein
MATGEAIRVKSLFPFGESLAVKAVHEVGGWCVVLRTDTYILILPLLSSSGIATHNETSSWKKI